LKGGRTVTHGRSLRGMTQEKSEALDTKKNGISKPAPPSGCREKKREKGRDKKKGPPEIRQGL